jgi:membrane protease YdiL (CAAX protease family)
MAPELVLGPRLLFGPLLGFVVFSLLAGGRLPAALPPGKPAAIVRRWASLGLAAGLEEAVWRGLVLAGLSIVAGALGALAASAAGFAAWHRRALGRRCAVHVLTGAAFGAAFLLGGLVAAVVAHGVYNVLVDWAVQAGGSRVRGP